ncbi:hypothetical protein PspLS_02671 [Pyricularia sp. CBS 133598]|nr:hypothetical protein PspLS_02671 [Pyricularia sp. CBS 133598]
MLEDFDGPGDSVWSEENLGPDIQGSLDRAFSHQKTHVQGPRITRAVCVHVDPEESIAWHRSESNTAIWMLPPVRRPKPLSSSLFFPTDRSDCAGASIRENHVSPAPPSSGQPSHSRTAKKVATRLYSLRGPRPGVGRTRTAGWASSRGAEREVRGDEAGLWFKDDEDTGERTRPDTPVEIMADASAGW